MAGQDEGDVVLTVRIGPGNFLLAAERVTEDLEFEIPPDDRFRIVGKPQHLARAQSAGGRTRR